MADVLLGGCETSPNRFGRILLAPFQARSQRLQRWRQDENTDHAGKNFSQLLRTLPIDFLYDVMTTAQRIIDPALRRAIKIAIHFGTF